MKCQAWVDPTKFSRKYQRPTARSLVGPYNFGWDYAISLQTPKGKVKLDEQRKRAVRCGGRVEFSMYLDSDEGGDTGSIEAELRCSQCGEYIHHVGMNAEIAEQWIQERLDSS